MEIPNQEIALRKFGEELLKKNDKIHLIKRLQNGRHLFVKTRRQKKYYLLFKNAPYYTFRKAYGVYSIGESINVECLYYCLDHKIDYILIAYNDGKIYYIKPQQWLNYANKHHSFRKVLKKQKLTKYGTERDVEEAVCSIDIKELKRFNSERDDVTKGVIERHLPFYKK